MAIAVVCSNCGKSLKVPDDRAGQRAKCPGCMTVFTVPGGAPNAVPSAAAIPGAAKARGPQKEAPTVAVSGTVVKLAVVLLVVGVPLSIFYFGPVRVHRQWGAMEKQAETDVTDVIVRGVQSHVSHSDFYDPGKTKFNAEVREVKFLGHIAHLTMPETVRFAGATAQGNFEGTYNTTNGEVVADVEIGGLTFAGVAKPMAKAQELIHVTGRKRGGELTAEVNGKNADVVVARPKEEKE